MVKFTADDLFSKRGGYVDVNIVAEKVVEKLIDKLDYAEINRIFIYEMGGFSFEIPIKIPLNEIYISPKRTIETPDRVIDIIDLLIKYVSNKKIFDENEVKFFLTGEINEPYIIFRFLITDNRGMSFKWK